jgi:hypothetical protein
MNRRTWKRVRLGVKWFFGLADMGGNVKTHHNDATNGVPEIEWRSKYDDLVDARTRVMYGVRMIGYFDEEGEYGIIWRVDAEDGQYAEAMVTGDLAFLLHVMNNERAGLNDYENRYDDDQEEWDEDNGEAAA